jgi:L-threonylcarbamoyladenylate synthase
MLERAVQTLLAGGCVAYPTETCWGLGVRADSPEAVESLRTIKGRQNTEPFSVLIADASWLDRLGVVLTDQHRRLIGAFWPGPLTLLFETETRSLFRHLASPYLGVRCSSHPIATELVTRFNHPITSTSANRHGQPVGDSALAIKAIFTEAEVLVLDAPDSGMVAVSTVLALESGRLRILRKGAVSPDALQSALDETP